MRSKLTPTTPVLALIAAAALIGLPASALAESTGGSVAPSAPSAPSVHTTGIATWFGPGFYGNKTACGQTLTPTVVGVANRTLPCGTLIKVSYAGHAIVVPVLDRGPYSNIGADWDLTAGAAAALGITETERIGTRVVGRTANTPTLGLPAGGAGNGETLAGGALVGATAAR